MKLKEAVEKLEGLKFITERLGLQSQPGRRCLLESEFLTDLTLLEKSFRPLDLTYNIIKSGEFSDSIARISRILMQIQDISHTIKRLGDGTTPDDVELFEIKRFSIWSQEVREILLQTPFSQLAKIIPPSLSEVISILDPENTGNTHFYIYDSYNQSLAQKRSELKKLQAQTGYDESLSDHLTAECLMLENEVRIVLGRQLQNYCKPLQEAIECIGQLDLLLAKASLAVDNDFCRPSFTTSLTSYSGLRYLPAEVSLQVARRSFQPVDIMLVPGVTLITGANMGGKTITLKSLGLAQALAQFTFYIPAASATITPVADILVSMGDSQSAITGLSSFGSEILRIDGIMKEAEHKIPCLILIDEPARTTNPEEGQAIVNAIVELLDELQSFSVVTTHYSGIRKVANRLKVKGLKETDSISEYSDNLRLEEFIDYSLIPDTGTNVDREALRIANLLGITPRFSDTIKKHIVGP